VPEPADCVVLMQKPGGGRRNLGPCTAHFDIVEELHADDSGATEFCRINARERCPSGSSVKGLA
jgi:hypothetical protein